MRSAWDAYVDGRHARLVSLWAQRLGMQTTGFRAEARRRLSMEPWRSDARLGIEQDESDEINEVLEVLLQHRYVPDAFRFSIEGRQHGWGHPVLTLELLEVTVTHPTVGPKLAYYERLWWVADGSDRIDFRVYEATGDDHITGLVTGTAVWERMTRETAA